MKRKLDTFNVGFVICHTQNTREQLRQIIVLALFISLNVATAETGAAGRITSDRDESRRPVFSTVPFTAVKVQDAFWSPRLETNRKVTVPYNLKQLEKQNVPAVFDIAAGKSNAKYTGWGFWVDSDIYKTLEGMAYCLAAHPDPAMEKQMEQIIARIIDAQEDDGYLEPSLQTKEPNYKHFSEDINRTGELYSMGHMIESAVAHFEATGHRNYLNAAIKLADLIDRTYGPGRKELPSGCPEIELALVRLYKVTGNGAYLELASFFVERAKHTTVHWSGGKPYLAHNEAVGHAVAALYLYSGAADVAVLTSDQALLNLLDRKWDNIVGRRMYITGGVGHRKRREGFAPDYVLPNRLCYSETCGSISQVMFNHRMFQAHQDARYIDVAERTLYNAVLAGVGLSGDRFFYVNPLESDGHWKFNHSDCVRFLWNRCPCCPTNVVRSIPSIPGMVYATAGDQLYVNLFIAGTAKVNIRDASVKLRQQTRYPWDGKVKIAVKPEKPSTFTLKVRIPGWARNQTVPSDLYRYDDNQSPTIKLSVNGKPLAIELDKGYALIRRQWRKEDVVTLDISMPVRRVVANSKVKDNVGRFAVERGPIVYCAEGADNDGSVLSKAPGPDVRFQLIERPDLLGGLVQIKMTPKENGDPLTMIPYYAWCHRGANEMAVWLPKKPSLMKLKAARPAPENYR